MILTVLLQPSQWEENGQEMSHNGTIFPPQSVRRLGQKIIKMGRYPLLHIISVQKID